MNPVQPARRRPLVIFVVKVLTWLMILMVAWRYAAPWSSHPVGLLTRMVLDFAAPDWVLKVGVIPGKITVDTQLTAMSAAGVGDIVLEADPAHYAYGLPLLWALLLAAGSGGRASKLLTGYLLLLPAQTFSLCLSLLKDMAIATSGGLRALGIAQWQLEAIALGYQLGVLIVPTVVPLMLWLWLDQGFVKSILRAPLRAQ